jgi:urease accessory protein
MNPHGLDAVKWLPSLLQTCDSSFPTGTYAHSFGLEELVRLGLVTDEESLACFLQAQILPALGQFELPYLRFARDAARAGDLAGLGEIDQEIDAFKICVELRNASIDLGVRRLEMLLQTGPSQLLIEFDTRRRNGLARGHHLTVFGMQTVDTPLEAALIAYLYGSVAATCAASLKLIRIGQAACQRVLHGCLEEAKTTAENSLVIARGNAGWFNPILEIASMRHANAHERLFIS